MYVKSKRVVNFTKLGINEFKSRFFIIFLFLVIFDHHFPFFISISFLSIFIYSELYKKSQSSYHQSIPESSEDLNVQNVMLSLMSEKDKLGEISKLIGKLQFAVEGKDTDQVQETESEINNISSYFPEEYKIGAILHLVKNNSLNSSKLIQLYIERCYKLADNDVDGVFLLDKAIDEIN